MLDVHNEMIGVVRLVDDVVIFDEHVEWVRSLFVPDGRGGSVRPDDGESYLRGLELALRGPYTRARFVEEEEQA